MSVVEEEDLTVEEQEIRAIERFLGVSLHRHPKIFPYLRTGVEVGEEVLRVCTRDAEHKKEKICMKEIEHLGFRVDVEYNKEKLGYCTYVIETTNLDPTS